MPDYPKTVTTNDGLNMYFKCEADEISAYNKEPGLFHKKPECIKESIIPVETVHKLMEEVIEDKPDTVEPIEVKPVVESPVIEEKRRPGRPAKRRW
jgi:hypothetical protein